MTEAFEKWVIQHDSNAAGAWREGHTDVLEQYCEEALFWLRAFVQEIDRREDECENSGLGCPYESRSQCRGDKLRSIVREFRLENEMIDRTMAEKDAEIERLKSILKRRLSG